VNNNFSAKIIFVLLLFVMRGAVTVVAQERDATMQFYLDNTAYVFKQNYIINKEIAFTVKVRSIFEQTDYRGKMEKSDTAVYAVYVSNGSIDSTLVIDSAGVPKNRPPDSLQPYLPWEESYDFYFYPNDTGAGRLAIGYESPVSDTTRNRTGFMNINRGNYDLQDIFLHSRNVEGYQRLSNVFSFERDGKFIRPLRFEQYVVKIAFMGHQYSRHYLEFFEYRIENI